MYGRSDASFPAFPGLVSVDAVLTVSFLLPPPIPTPQVHTGGSGPGDARPRRPEG